jgi:hypothetical protein
MKIFILLLAFCLAQAALPEVLIGNYGNMMRVLVVALRNESAESTWAFVVPPEKESQIKDHYNDSEWAKWVDDIAKDFDPEKITTYFLLFPQDSPQANLNVALGGEPLQDLSPNSPFAAYFAVHYQKEGKEWVPKIMMCEGVKNDIYTISIGAKDTYTFDGRPYHLDSSFAEKEFTMVEPPTSENGASYYVRGDGGEIIVQTTRQRTAEEEVAAVVFREMRVEFHYPPQKMYLCYTFIVPFVTFNPKYADQKDRLKLVQEPIMAFLKKVDPEDLLGYQRAAAAVQAKELMSFLPWGSYAELYEYYDIRYGEEQY